MLTSLFDTSLESRRQEAIGQSAVADYMERALTLQREILGGKVDFSTSDPDPQREVLFTTTEIALLVNAGLRVLITTHSPYIVDHLASLMKAATNIDKDAIARQFFLHDSRAFISQDEVAVYKVEHGKVENILDEDGIINWGTFGDVSNRIIEIYSYNV
jgi:hypothetical protein